MKILLAEADGAPAGRLFHLLVKNGYQTTAVKTGQAAPDCLIKPVDDNELLLRIPALQRRTQTGSERCRNLSFLSSTTLDPKRASAAVRMDCRACHACAGHGTIKIINMECSGRESSAMPRPKWTLNTIYISERLQERLRPISRCALTTVVAPMGYGKTTAVNWYLAGRAKAEDAAIVRISVYSDHLAIFWKSVQDAFEHARIPLLRGYACPDDAAGASLLADDLCHGLAGRGSVYIFIDDFHLLTDGRITEFLCTLVNRLPENVHLIVASRDRFLPGDAVVRLGSRVYPIGAEHLRLNHTELSIYAHRCGTDLTDAQVETLLHASEGWFSAVYLNLRTLSERGALPDQHSDIYTMFSAAMIEPLSPRQQEFLAVMGLADEFTAPMARFVTGTRTPIAS